MQPVAVYYKSTVLIEKCKHLFQLKVWRNNPLEVCDDCQFLLWDSNCKNSLHFLSFLETKINLYFCSINEIDTAPQLATEIIPFPLDLLYLQKKMDFLAKKNLNPKNELWEILWDIMEDITNKELVESSLLDMQTLIYLHKIVFSNVEDYYYRLNQVCKMFGQKYEIKNLSTISNFSNKRISMAGLLLLSRSLNFVPFSITVNENSVEYSGEQVEWHWSNILFNRFCKVYQFVATKVSNLPSFEI